MKQQISKVRLTQIQKLYNKIAVEPLQTAELIQKLEGLHNGDDSFYNHMVNFAPLPQVVNAIKPGQEI